MWHERIDEVRLAGHLLTVLDAVAVDPGRRVADVPVLTSAERDWLLVAWNDTAAPVPVAGGVFELVADVAAVVPDAAAVVCGGRVLTYGGLVGRAGPEER